MGDAFSICDGRCGFFEEHPRMDCPASYMWEITEDNKTSMSWVKTTCTICFMYHFHVYDPFTKSVECLSCSKRNYVSYLSVLNNTLHARILDFHEEKEKRNEQFNLKLLIEGGIQIIKDSCLTFKEFEEASKGTFNGDKNAFRGAYVAYHRKHSPFYGEGRLYLFKNYYIPEQMIDRQFCLIANSCEKMQLEEQKRMFLEDERGNCRTENSKDTIYHLNLMHRNVLLSLKDMGLIGTQVWVGQKWKTINIPISPDVPPPVPAPKGQISTFVKKEHENRANKRLSCYT